MYADDMKKQFQFLLLCSLAASQLQCASFRKASKSKSTAVPVADNSGAGEVRLYMEDPPAEEMREPAAAAASKKYKTEGEPCGEYPRVNLRLPPGFCAGLMYDGTSTMKRPRNIVEHKEGEKTVYFILDMQTWGTNHAVLYRLDLKGKAWVATKLLAADSFSEETEKALMHLGSALLKGPDGRIYVGGAKYLWSFDPSAAKDTATLLKHIQSVSLKTAIVGPPLNPKKHLHGLMHFVFNAKGDLIVNKGTASDNCQEEAGRGVKTCQEAEQYGMVMRYPRNANGTFGKPIEIARGLRNSVALAIDPRNQFLYQGENSRDFIEKVDKKLDGMKYPADELNLIVQNGDYGWPYCYNDGIASPEFPKAKCETYNAPLALLPAHSAPLGMIFYSGKAGRFPGWYKNKLFISLHGPPPGGHRLAVVGIEEDGRLINEPYEFIGEWGKTFDNGKDRSEPIGKPMGLLEAADGSLLVVEDQNQTVLKIIYDGAQGDGLPKFGLNYDGIVKPSEPVDDVDDRRRGLEERLRNDKNTFAKIQAQVIDAACVQCHNPDSEVPPVFKQYDDLGNARLLRGMNDQKLVVGKVYAAPDEPKKSEFYIVIESQKMPKSGFHGDTPEEQQKNYLNALQLINQWLGEGAPVDPVK